jgi:hypothetical protein
MNTVVSFKLCAVAFVVLALPVLTPAAGCCVAQQPSAEVAAPAVAPGDQAVRRGGDLTGSARVLVADLRAAVLLVRDPDEAYARLKEAMDATRNDPKLSEPCREILESHLESVLWGVSKAGFSIKQLDYEWAALKADLRIRLALWRFERQR